MPDPTARDPTMPDPTMPDPTMPDPTMPDPTDQAADRPASPAAARSRLRQAVVRPTRAQLVVAVLLAVVGFAAVTQMRSTEVDDTYSGAREQDLIDLLNGLAGASQRAEREIARLQRTRDDLETTATARQAALEQAEDEAATLGILAGLVPVTGPGIRVRIEDADGRLSIDSLLDLIQELRTAGAEAIEVNDQVRVVAQSALEVGEDGIYLDGRLVTSPYLLDVVGDPHTLAGAVTFFRGPQETIEAEGATVAVEELDALDVESVREPTAPEYAEPEPGQ